MGGVDGTDRSGRVAGAALVAGRLGKGSGMVVVKEGMRGWYQGTNGHSVASNENEAGSGQSSEGRVRWFNGVGG